MKASITGIDKSVTRFVQSLPKQSRPIMKIASIFGEPVMSGLILVLAGLSAIFGHRPHEVQAFVTALVILPVASVIKLFVHRTRPDSYIPSNRLSSYSFPSGHAYGSLLALGLIAVSVDSILVTAFANVMILFIGTSRIYLGAHFPSDVLGGWLMAVFALIFIILTAGII